MKKFLSLILFFSLLFSATACMHQNIDKKTTEKYSFYAQNEATSEIVNDKSNAPSTNDLGGGTLSLTKYRSIYCDIPRPFINLVDVYEYQEWFEEIIKDDPNKTEIMPMKLFVQEFNITREEFDKANLEWTKIIIDGFHGTPLMNPQDFANQETDEVYNADIIYTFDDEIINSYYLSHEYPFVYISEYENALEDGTYETRTTDWVDIEQMEAEIIAKYGEAEIVTTVVVEEIPIEETTVEESTEALTDIPETTVPET